jgi:transcriptional regulator with XRE-family HTH domain
MQIGTILKNKRLALDMSQIEIANMSGVTQGMISRLEGGYNNISVETLRKLAKALDCVTIDLLPEEDKTSLKS